MQLLWIIWEKLFENGPSKICGRQPRNPFKFFKGCFPQILLGLFLNTLSHMSLENFYCVGTVLPIIITGGWLLADFINASFPLFLIHLIHWSIYRKFQIYLWDYCQLTANVTQHEKCPYSEFFWSIFSRIWTDLHSQLIANVQFISGEMVLSETKRNNSPHLVYLSCSYHITK